MSVMTQVEILPCTQGGDHDELVVAARAARLASNFRDHPLDDVAVWCMRCREQIPLPG